ncbi:alpha/beta hydrolase [Candidatus Dojkabacteria bacterium]|nr:alpha/beta hydrolase [Candidatus Dojkabacteria bacterium]
MKKIQILYIHGGDTFKTHKDYINFLKTREISIKERIRWSGEYLTKALGDDFQIIRPRMPLQDNAKYEEWKIQFERYLPFLSGKIILIGASLGGIFLAQYLSENKLPQKVLSAYLICPPYDDSLTGEDLDGGFKLKENLSLLEKNTQNLYLLFSKDDDVVPIAHAAKYKKKLNNAKFVIFESKNGHFVIEEFPEIVKMIKKDIDI